MAEENRQLILTRAMELFALRGYDAVGVQEICAAASITKPTLYHYFGSKRGLLDALVQDYTPSLLAAVSAATAYAGDLPMTLEKLMTGLIHFAKDNPDFYRMLLSMVFAPRDSEANAAGFECYSQLHSVLETLFAAAVTQHGNMRGRQQVYAVSFLGLINTYIGLWLNGHSELTEADIRQAVKQFSHGIYS